MHFPNCVHADSSFRNVYPDKLEYVDHVLEYATKEVRRFANSADLHSQSSQMNLLNILLAPVKAYFSLFTALTLPNFIPLLHAQPYPTRRAVAGEVARNILRNETKITTKENLQGILDILAVLVKEGMQQSGGYPGGPARRVAAETDETVEEQGWLARIVHLLKGEDANTQFQVCHSSPVADCTLIFFRSCYRSHEIALRRAMNESSTRHPPSSPQLSNLHGGTKLANTCKTTGPRSRHPFTSSPTL